MSGVQWVFRMILLVASQMFFKPILMGGPSRVTLVAHPLRKNMYKLHQTTPTGIHRKHLHKLGATELLSITQHKLKAGEGKRPLSQPSSCISSPDLIINVLG